MIEPRGAATARAAYERPTTLNAPLFRSMIEHLDPDRRWVVLDLGAAQNETIALLGRFRCRLEIADLTDELDMLNAAGEAEAEELGVLAESLLTVPEEPTDIVLCWDLLNYLEPPALGALTQRLAARAREGALMHALIVYSEPKMPARPGRFVPHEDCRLENLSKAPDERSAPRYSPDDLSRYMPDCRIERAVLLGNGMQEFLFRLKRLPR